MMKVIDEQVSCLRRSLVYNEDYYLREFPDVRMVGIDPALHYLKYGRNLGRLATECPITGIFVGVASIPSRLDSFRKTIASIIDQVDHIFVHLNNFQSTPEFLINSKISITYSMTYGDLRDTGKFLALREVSEDSVFFTIDDDIIYPEDYVVRMIGALKKFKYRAIIGVHGVIYPENTKSFFDRITMHFMKALPVPIPVSLLGTGTVCFRVGTIKPEVGDFTTHGMADIFFAGIAKGLKVPMIAIDRGEGWLFDPDQTDSGKTSLYNETRTNSLKHNDALKSLNPWGFQTIANALGLSASSCHYDLVGSSLDLIRFGIWLEQGQSGNLPFIKMTKENIELSRFLRLPEFMKVMLMVEQTFDEERADDE